VTPSARTCEVSSVALKSLTDTFWSARWNSPPAWPAAEVMHRRGPGRRHVQPAALRNHRDSRDSDRQPARQRFEAICSRCWTRSRWQAGWMKTPFQLDRRAMGIGHRVDSGQLRPGLPPRFLDDRARLGWHLRGRSAKSAKTR